VDIYRGLVMRRNDPLEPVPPVRYEFRPHALRYLRSTFSAGSVLSAVVTGGGRSLFDKTENYGTGFERYSNHMEANLVRHVIQRSIQFGSASLLQQEEAFATSKEERIGKRVQAALYHSFFVPGRDGNEFAFPRLAAALGTGWIVHKWHPWREDNINPWQQASLILASYVARSFWQEFKPDIKNGLRSGRRRLFKQAPDDPLLALSSSTKCSAHCK
jgi:hypothetical protein